MCFQLHNQGIDVHAQLSQCIERKFVNAPANAIVQQLVFLVRQHDQIFRSIIKSIRIAVMYMFGRCQWTAKDALHYQAMFSHFFPMNRKESISAQQGTRAVCGDKTPRIKQGIGIHSLGVHRTKSHRCATMTPPLIRRASTQWNLTTQWQCFVLAAFSAFADLVQQVQLVKGHVDAFSFQAIPPTVMCATATTCAMPISLAAQYCTNRRGSWPRHNTDILTYKTAVLYG